MAGGVTSKISTSKVQSRVRAEFGWFAETVTLVVWPIANNDLDTFE